VIFRNVAAQPAIFVEPVSYFSYNRLEIKAKVFFYPKPDFGTVPALSTGAALFWSLLSLFQAIRRDTIYGTEIIERGVAEKMSIENPTANNGWSSIQAYTLSAICLLIGLTMGYLFRGSNEPKAPGAAPAAQSKMSSRNPAGGLGPNATQPTPEAMKRMADKQVAPLLEQLKSNPKDAETLAKVAQYYMIAEQYKDAATYYEKTAEVKPTPEIMTELANAYYYAGSADKAIETLQRALQLDPNYTNALYNLGVLKWQVQGDSTGAIQCWKKVLKTNLDQNQRAQVEKMIAKAKEHASIPAGTKTDKPRM
jgi:cytochrome c-type biogenesis protein CcmH/NrfG